jgi:medium-chain acyl-[acyl-carrier-protein] hydrolase
MGDAMSLAASPGRWVVRPAARRDAQLRLFCFPYAGAGVTAFRAWWNDLPSAIEVCLLQLPGREGRLREPPFTRMAPLVTALAEAVAPHLDLPFSFFGHSVGGLVAFELARELRRRRGADPSRLVVSATAAPPNGMPASLRDRDSDADLVRVLGSLGGTPSQILQDPEIMRLLAPAVRADLGIYEAYSYVAETPLRCPITVMRGTADPLVGEEDVIGWTNETSGRVDFVAVPGTHFFLHEARDTVLRVLGSALLAPATTAS